MDDREHPKYPVGRPPSKDEQKMSREEREERKARREARKHNYEYRPGAADGADYARRLERGSNMNNESECDDGGGD